MDRLTGKIKEYEVYFTSSACISEIPDMIYGKKYCGSAIFRLGVIEDILEKYNIDSYQRLEQLIEKGLNYEGLED